MGGDDSQKLLPWRGMSLAAISRVEYRPDLVYESRQNNARITLRKGVAGKIARLERRHFAIPRQRLSGLQFGS